MQNDYSDVRTISVAILADEPLGWGSGKHYFPIILNDFSWRKDGITYIIKTHYVHDHDILKGKLNTADYSVLLAPGGGVGDGHAVMKSFNVLRKVRHWKKKINLFIEDGGGYVGICGGTALITGLSTGKTPRFHTFLERSYHKSRFNISKINSFYRHLAFPLLYPFQYINPDFIGATGYVFSFAPGQTKQGTRIHTGGVPIDFSIDRSHPFFSDLDDEILRMRWWGGPALEIQDDPDRLIQPVAWYPSKEFSLQDCTKINAWRYVGGLTGLLKALWKAARFIRKHNKSFRDVLMYCYFFAGDWERTEKCFDLKFSGKPAMTTEIYPNEHKARIVLCTTHPEYMIWRDGCIQEVDDKGFHCLANGLHQWKNISVSKENILDELTHTWWLVRRMVAWAAKIPEDHLPPRTDEIKTEGIQKILDKNIFWDGSIDDQIHNI